jgi:transposase InsO family protein
VRVSRPVLREAGGGRFPRPTHPYIGTDEGWLYLAVVLDLFSRKVVGWSMSDRMTATLVCDALRMALFRRKLPRVA